MNDQDSPRPLHPNPSGDDRLEVVRDPAEAPDFVVAIGTSAGGLQALREFFSSMSPRTGAGFVVLQHLSPESPSLTPELLSKHTSMPLRQARHGAPVRADEVVFLPPGAILRIRNGRLLVEEREATTGSRTVIDIFLRSLAEDCGQRAMGILLSGSGSDGTLGLQAVRAHGGATLVQDPRTAEFDGMPLSAVRAEAADYVEPVAELAATLADLLSRRRGVPPEAEPLAITEPDLERIAASLHRYTGHDFSGYKRGTLTRRLRRRLQLRESASVEEYARLLERDDGEASHLFRDLMIGVTEFFRDPEMWDELGARVLPELLSEREAGDPVRVWAVGCTTGEEAYSLAIVLEEALSDRGEGAPALPVKIFATDIDERGLAFAREGVYPEGIAQHVSEARLERFFVREDDHYRVAKRIRDRCIFAPHNLLQDPPFSRLDLISCRNLLIYLKAEAQQRAATVFQYSLRPGGHLVLGKSENLASHHEFFDPVSPDRRIYRRTEHPAAAASTLLDGMLSEDRFDIRTHTFAPTQLHPKPQNIRRTVEQLLLQRYGPAALLIDERREMLQYFGRTRRYIEPSAAEGSGSVVDMALPDLRRPLRLAIGEAERERREVVRKGVRVDTDGRAELVDITVRPASEVEPDSALLVVVFEGRPTEAPPQEAAPWPESSAVQRELEEELRDTRQQLQATIQKLQSANEELQSANEELISMNEELQTSKEEAQSVNEELNTVNIELKNKLEELRQANDDLQNLFRSTQIATVFLDRERRIKRFTPTVTDLFRLRDSDVGRSIDDITHRFSDGNLEEAIEEVLRTLVPEQVEVQTPEDGRWYTLRISPYRTLDVVIEGVVLTFTDISEIKRTEQRLREERRYAQSIVESVHEPLLVLGPDLRVLSASRAFHEAFRTSPDEVQGEPFLELAGGQWNMPELEEALRRVLPDGDPVRGLEIELPDEEQGAMRVDARPLRVEGNDGERVLVSLMDISDLRARERRREEEARRKDWFLAMLGHELRNPLAPMRNTVHLLQRQELDEAQRGRMFEILERQLAHLTRLVDDTLDISRITEGKLPLTTERLELGELVRDVADDHRPAFEESGLTLELELSTRTAPAVADAVRVAQALGNLLDNARKYTQTGGRVTVALRTLERGLAGGEWAEITVADTGTGMTPDLVGRVFEAFQQGPRGPEYTEQGLGVGLTLVRTVAVAHGGSVRAESEGLGQGSVFRLLLPLAEGSAEEAAEEAAEPAPTGRATPPAQGSPRRILVVEDREETGETTRLLLELEGHEVRTVETAAAGLETLREFRPDVVFCDLGLPGGMNGYDLARAVRSDPELASVHLCALTGYGQESDRARAQQAGFDAYLVKPVSVDHLRHALRDVARV